MDLIYTGSRKRQDLLSKLGIWGPWERAEGERRRREGNGEKYIAQYKHLKKRNGVMPETCLGSSYNFCGSG